MRARTFTIALAAALTGLVASAQQPTLPNLLPVPLAPPTAPKVRPQATPPAPPALPRKGKVELAAVAQDERCE